MSPEFLQSLFVKHSTTATFPPTSSIARLVTKTLLLLFPEQTKKHYDTEGSLRLAFEKVEIELTSILTSMQRHLTDEASVIAKAFMTQVPEVYRQLNTDVEAIMAGDPAATCEYEVIRAYPGFYAIAFYRMAHALHSLEIPLLPRKYP